MTTLNEFDYELNIVQSGIKTAENEQAMNARIMEWFDTPLFSMANNVKWGHPLRQFQFDPVSELLGIEIEMVVAMKIRQDIDKLKLKYIRVETSGEIDKASVYIVHNYGVFDEEVKYREGSNGGF